MFENIHPFKSAERRIRKLGKALCRKRKGSSNRDKARRRLAKVHERITAQREAYLHSIVNALLSKHDVIFLEDLNVAGMLKNRRLSKAIGELGLRKFIDILKDKTSLNGKMLVEISR